MVLGSSGARRSPSDRRRVPASPSGSRCCSARAVRLEERRSELDRYLREDGLSQRLAAYYGDWIVHCGRADHLERYAKDMVRRIATPIGEEVMVRRADGVVLLVTPGNSPTINTAPIFSMLLVGNAVLMRSPSNDRGPRFIVDDIIRSALLEDGLSPDLVHVLTGRSRQVMAEVMPCADVRTVVFFGNARAGASVAAQAHELGKKAVLELEGSDHMVVWSDADLDAAADSAIHCFDFGTLPCPIPKHLLVHDAVFDAFVEKVIARVPEYAVTIAADVENGNLMPLIKPDAFDAALAEAVGLGKLRCGGHRMGADGQAAHGGAYGAPTLVELSAEACLNNRLRCF